MEPTDKTLVKEQVSLGHFSAIALCAGFLILITFMKSGFKLPEFLSFNKTPQTQVKVLTFAEAKNQVIAENNLGGQGIPDNSMSNNLALIDPDSLGEEVLGASTGTDTSDLFPAAETVFTSESLAPIKINLLSQTSPELIKKYAGEMEDIEARYDSLTILSDLSQDDKTTLAGVSGQIDGLIAEMDAVAVPSNLEEYHKLKMIYYSELSLAADFYAGKPGAQSMDDTTTTLFSVTNRLERIKSEVSQNYGVSL